MRWFLDMCIILDYIHEGDNQSLITKTINFVDNKKQEKFILCHYIKEKNIPKWLNRKRMVFRELLRQIKNSSYKPYTDNECRDLWLRDKNQILKLLSLENTFKDKVEMIQSFENAYQEIKRRIKEFIDKNIDEFVVPIKEIDQKLVGCLFNFLIPNDSDSNTLASAIQEHNKKEISIITADKKDWTKELLDEVHNDFNLKKIYVKLPEIKYLQNFN